MVTPSSPAPPLQPEPEGSEAAVGLADGRKRPLDPRLVPCERLGGGLLVGGLFLASMVGGVFSLLGDEVNRGRLALLSLLVTTALGLLAALTWIHPRLKLRTSSWALSRAGLELRSGVWFQHVRTLPRARVQHTDVERGPIERRYGLATLVVHTAGHQDSEVRLGGLAHETAVAIRDDLLAGGGAARGA